MRKPLKTDNILNYILLSIILLILSLQITITFQINNSSSLVSNDVKKIKSPQDISNEKIRQEILQLKIENEQKKLFWQTFFSTFGTAITIIVAFSGGWIAFDQFISSKNKDRFEKNSELLNKLLDGILMENENVQAANIVALIPFFDSEMSEFHDRIALAISSLAKNTKKTKIVEEAFVNIFILGLQKIPKSMKTISWQGFHISQTTLDLSLYKEKIDITQFDFRDSIFSSTEKSKISLANLDLTGIDFRNAKLVGVDFSNSNLENANLEYADLSFSNCFNTSFKNSNLLNIKVEELNLAYSNLENARISKYGTSWNLIKNKWSIKNLNDDLKTFLKLNYFPEPTESRILMLLTEFPPNVIGGLWTSVYNMTISLRKIGVNIVIMAPITPEQVKLEIFGIDIEIIPVETNLSNTYRETRSGTPVSIADNSYLHYSRASMEKFSSLCYKKILELNLKFDLIHAHDWVTFPAADFLAKEFHVNWIAHFHSTESQRNQIINQSVLNIERNGCINSTKIVVPGSATKSKLVSDYGIDPEKISIIPNIIIKEKSIGMTYGAFESKKILFSGRLTWQKGPDIFINIANNINQLNNDYIFKIYGHTDNKNYSNFLIKKSQNRFKSEDNENNTTLVTKNDKKFIEINSIYPIELLENNEVDITGNYSEVMPKELRYHLFETGFTATPYQSKSEKLKYIRHTHIIKFNNNDITKYFLAEIAGIKGYTTPKNKTSLIFFQGYTDWFKRKTMFEEAAAIVVPSRHEPFGMIILEAFEAGIPVLYPNNSGVAEFMDNGFLIDSNNLEADATDKLKILLEDKEIWSSLIERQRNLLENYLKEIHERKFISLWATLTNQNSDIAKLQ